MGGGQNKKGSDLNSKFDNQAGRNNLFNKCGGWSSWNLRGNEETL